MPENRKLLSFETLVGDVSETVYGIVKSKLRVSLNFSDNSYENQNALQLYQDVLVRLMKQLRMKEDALNDSIKNVRDYAAVVTHHTCAEYRRYSSPEWYSLKNKVRYYLTERSGFAVWKSAHNELICGFAVWQQRVGVLNVMKETVDALIKSFHWHKNIRHMSAHDWEKMLSAIFIELKGPIELDMLVNLVANLLDVEDHIPQSITKEDNENNFDKSGLISTEYQPDKTFEMRSFLRHLWQEVCQLKPAQRIVYLLNLTDAEGDLNIFVCNGIVSIVGIGRTLDLSEQQFEILWSELALNEEVRQTAQRFADYDEKFVFLWPYLPLLDELIAKMLRCQRQNVITLRYRARETIAKKLKSGHIL